MRLHKIDLFPCFDLDILMTRLRGSSSHFRFLRGFCRVKSSESILEAAAKSRWQPPLGELPEMMSASEGGGGSWKSGGCVNCIVYDVNPIQMRTRGERGSKNTKILRTSYLEAPLPHSVSRSRSTSLINNAPWKFSSLRSGGRSAAQQMLENARHVRPPRPQGVDGKILIKSIKTEKFIIKISHSFLALLSNLLFTTLTMGICPEFCAVVHLSIDKPAKNTLKKWRLIL